MAVTGLALLMAFTAGSVFADSRLNATIGELIGTKYKSGGTTTSGFDCSGFTTYVFKQFGISLPRTSADQSQVGEEVDKSELQAGDLVFFNTNGRGVSHVGIYVGDGKFAHSSSSKGVIISGLGETYYANRYVTARRVMDAQTFEAIASDAAAAEEAAEAAPAA